jgi:hypothetical protein
MLRELVLTSPDGVITGQVDLLLLGDRPSVIDHKTGLVLNDGAPRAQYQRQLAIYAWLVEVTMGVDLREAALFSLREGIVELDVSSPVRDVIVADALGSREAFNDRVPGAQLAMPSDEACAVCPFVGPCDPAWDALSRGTVERFGWGEAARALVRDHVVTSASGTAAVPLSIETGTVAGEGILIDVPSRLVSSVSIGDRLAAARVAKKSDEPLVLAWRDGTSALEIGV